MWLGCRPGDGTSGEATLAVEAALEADAALDADAELAAIAGGEAAGVE